MKLKELVNKLLSNRYLAFCITLIIFILCSMPSEQLPKGNDKSAHFIVFAGWAFCHQFVFRQYAKTLIIGILYGIFIEFWQGILPQSFHRNFDWYDALADSIGVLIGLLLYFFTAKFISTEKI
ncbi:VanZ family protein [Emticicia oligotrophica DSM 17448]|uniref:VanZ family protein n=2 Tax=Emticicia TaxID=312278 RepID=A0ABN4AP89_EMTOG|nr:VanZ family protein [Emticicia oligotrophica DSM 17448]